MKKSKRDRTIFDNDKDSSLAFYSKLDSKEIAMLEKAKELLLPIIDKHKISFEDLKDLFEKKLSFPASIFTLELTVLESIVKFLKEEKDFTLRSIAEILNRDERNIWHIYNKSKQKYSKKIIIKKEKFAIPVSIFSNKKLSAQESIVVYLKDELNFSYHKIALLLKRDDRTIWTVYQRARKKNVKPE